MAGRIGGNIEEMQGTAGAMTDTGTQFVDAGGTAQQFASTMESEVEDVTNVLRTHFEGLGGDLRQAVSSAQTRLGSTDWTGNAQLRATEAEGRLNGQISTFLTQTSEAVAQFKASLMTQANEFVGMVQGDFNRIMGNIDAEYGALSTGTRQTATGLEEVDSSARF